MNGIVIIDKPQGWTSQDVTARLRRVFRTKRIGHGGTLDPMATGVLPVFVGRATRAVEFFEHAEKTYETVLRLGVITDTQDTEGRILEEAPAEVSDDKIRQTLSGFRGEQQQIPPMYSAVKINGRKLYEMARKGLEVERQPRMITIHELTFIGRDGPDVSLRVRCSKGTYIRTLCADIGNALGCGGCMASLRRTSAGEYTLQDAVPLQELLDASDAGDYLRPVDSMFSELPAAVLTESQERRCRCGNPFRTDLADGRCRVYSADGEFLMLAEVQGGIMKTVKSFFEV